MPTRVSSKGSNFRLYCFLSLLSFIIALGFRLYGITLSAPQSDERHWVNRSHDVLMLLRIDPGNATTGIGHPGVPPALIMAAGQWLQEKYNNYYKLAEGAAGYLFKLDASRIAVALVSSLTAPLVFLGVLYTLGLQPALLAGLLLALDPRHIGYSRIAHLDAVLTLLTVGTIFLYIVSIKQRKLGLKLLAGAFWGLSVATKPTAGMLLIAFVFYKAVRCCLVRKENDGGERAIISWSDLGAFLVGHGIFAAIYTRLWNHRGDYRDRLQIKTELAKWFWRTGLYLQRHPEVFVPLIIVIVVGVYLLVRSYGNKKTAWKYHLSMLLGLIGIFSVALYLFPEVLENIARFWKWASGLSEETHKAFGRTLPPVRYGYLWLFLSELPNLVLFGIVLSILSLLWLLSRKGAGEKTAFLLFCIFCSLTWISFLSISSKQAWRYALPVVPLFYILAGFGLSKLFWLITRIFSGSDRRKERAASLLAFVVIGIQGALTYSWFPHYQIFFNNFTGGLAGALRRRHGFAFVGQNEAVEYLYKQARKDNEQKFITVAGDAAAFEYTYRRLYPRNQGLLSFADYKPEKSDYLVVFASHKTMLDRRSWEDTVYAKPVFSYYYRGVELLYIFDSVVPDGFKEERLLSVEYNHRRTGRLEKIAGAKQAIVARPGRDKAGFLFFTEGYRLPAGSYNFTVSLKLLVDDQSKSYHLRSDQVVRLDLSPDCEHVVRVGDLSDTRFKKISLVCNLQKKKRLIHQIEWPGTVAVAVADPKFQREK